MVGGPHYLVASRLRIPKPFAMRTDSAPADLPAPKTSSTLKLLAVPPCERYSPVPVCILVWCRPGGSRIISTAPVTDMPRR
jgi:hypothetical protein